MSEQAAEYRPVKAQLRPAFYATKPTGLTLFLRTFLPWQIWRFVRINFKMLLIIRKSHKGH